MNLLRGAGLLVGALALVACGNEVVLEDGGGGASSSSKASTGTQGPTTSTGTTMSSGVTSTTTGTPAMCVGLSLTQCLGAFPTCAPLYDDACCPSCAPGPCADCIDMQFYECLPASEACTGAAMCGYPSKENCAGLPADCFDDYCPANPGCTPACKTDASGNCVTDECHAVTADTCTSFCDGIPPNCPPGYTAEQNGSCFTGFCIPGQVCQ